MTTKYREKIRLRQAKERRRDLRAARRKFMCGVGNVQAYAQERYHLACGLEGERRTSNKVGADNGPEHRAAVFFKSGWYRLMLKWQVTNEERARMARWDRIAREQRRAQDPQVAALIRSAALADELGYDFDGGSDD